MEMNYKTRPFFLTKAFLTTSYGIKDGRIFSEKGNISTFLFGGEKAFDRSTLLGDIRSVYKNGWLVGDVTFEMASGDTDVAWRSVWRPKHKKELIEKLKSDLLSSSDSDNKKANRTAENKPKSWQEWWSSFEEAYVKMAHSIYIALNGGEVAVFYKYLKSRQWKGWKPLKPWFESGVGNMEFIFRVDSSDPRRAEMLEWFWEWASDCYRDSREIDEDTGLVCFRWYARAELEKSMDAFRFMQRLKTEMERSGLRPDTAFLDEESVIYTEDRANAIKAERGDEKEGEDAKAQAEETANEEAKGEEFGNAGRGGNGELSEALAFMRFDALPTDQKQLRDRYKELLANLHEDFLGELNKHYNIVRDAMA